MGAIRRSLDPRAEEGIALVLSLAVLVFFSITTVAAVTMANSTTRSAASGGAQQNAYAMAEAGINSAQSILNSASNNPSSPTLLGCSTSGVNAANSATPCTDLTTTTSFGTASFHGLYTQGANSGTWVITSIGSVPYQNGAGSLTRVTTATATITGGGQAGNISVWNYAYSTGVNAGGCEVDITGNNVTVDVPVFVTGDLCLDGNNSTIQENTANGGQKVDVRILGKLVYGAPNTSVGTSVKPITSGLVSGGCTTSIGGVGHTCTPPGDAWYVSSTDSPITATPPVTDFPGWYLNASPGPNHICDTTLTPRPNLTAATNKFDSNGTMDGTNPSFDLTPAASYNCVTASGSLSWNSVTQLLTIGGTIFFDGNVTSSSTGAMYRGKAAIYVNGTFTLSGNNQSLRAACPAAPAAANHQCAWGSTSTEWNPNVDNLLIVAGKAGAIAISLGGNNTQFQGGLLCPSTSTADLVGNNVITEGALICGKFLWAQNMTMMPLPSLTNLPPGAPVPPNSPATISAPTYTG